MALQKRDNLVLRRTPESDPNKLDVNELIAVHSSRMSANADNKNLKSQDFDKAVVAIWDLLKSRSENLPSTHRRDLTDDVEPKPVSDAWGYQTELLPLPVIGALTERPSLI